MALRFEEKAGLRVGGEVRVGEKRRRHSSCMTTVKTFRSNLFLMIYFFMVRKIKSENIPLQLVLAGTFSGIKGRRG